MPNPNRPNNTQANELDDRWKDLANFESDIWGDVKHEGNPNGKYTAEEAEKIVDAKIKENEAYEDRLEKPSEYNAIETWTEDSTRSRELTEQYPRQEGESKEDYAVRLAKIEKMTRYSESLSKRQEQLNQQVKEGALKPEEAEAIIEKAKAGMVEKAEASAQERVDAIMTDKVREAWEKRQEEEFNNLSDEERADLEARHPEFKEGNNDLDLDAKIEEVKKQLAELEALKEAQGGDLKNGTDDMEPTEFLDDLGGEVDPSPKDKKTGEDIAGIDPYDKKSGKGMRNWLSKQMGSKKFRRLVVLTLITSTVAGVGAFAFRNAKNQEKSPGNKAKAEVNIDQEKEKGDWRELEINIDGESSKQEFSFEKYSETRDPFNDKDKDSAISFGANCGEGVGAVLDINQNTLDSKEVLAHWMGILGEDNLDTAEELNDANNFKKAQNKYFEFMKGVDHYKTRMIAGGEHYMSEHQDADKKIHVSPDVVHDTESHIISYMNKDGENILDKGDFKARIMEKFGIDKSEWGNYEVLGRRSECGGQLVLQKKGSGETFSIPGISNIINNPNNPTPNNPNNPNKPNIPNTGLEAKGSNVYMDNANQQKMGVTQTQENAVRASKENHVNPNVQPGSEVNSAGVNSGQSSNAYESNAQVINEQKPANQANPNSAGSDTSLTNEQLANIVNGQ